MAVEQKLRLGLWLRYWAGLRLAPHVGTPAHVAHRMLKLAQVGPADRVVDLGCGDARLLIAGQYAVYYTALDFSLVYRCMCFAFFMLGVSFVEDVSDRGRACIGSTAEGLCAVTLCWLDTSDGLQRVVRNSNL